MKFLVDESVGNKLANILKNLGYDIVFVGDRTPAIKDEEVLSFSDDENRVLITADKGFGKLIFELKMHISGLILLRTLTRDPEKRFEMLKDILDKTEGKFIVVRKGQIRVKKL